MIYLIFHMTHINDSFSEVGIMGVEKKEDDDEK